MHQKISTYKNLRNGRYMVRAVGGPDDGKVIGSCAAIVVADVDLKVAQLEAEKVKQTGRRSKHAYAVGVAGRLDDFRPFKRHADTDTARTLREYGPCDLLGPHVKGRDTRLSYNPFKDTSFKANGAPIEAASLAFLSREQGNWVMQ